MSCSIRIQLNRAAFGKHRRLFMCPSTRQAVRGRLPSDLGVTSDDREIMSCTSLPASCCCSGRTRNPSRLFYTLCRSSKDAEGCPALVPGRSLCRPVLALLTWARVTQYRFLTSASEPTLTVLHTVLAKSSRSSQSPHTNTTDQDNVALSTQIPRLCYPLAYLGAPHSTPQQHQSNMRTFRSLSSLISTRK